MKIEIHWADRIFTFSSQEEALKAGFHVPKHEVVGTGKPPVSTVEAVATEGSGGQAKAAGA